MVYKRGKTYWYKFTFRGELIRRSTKQGNQRVAGQMEAAYRTALAKGEVGLIEPAEPIALKEFAKRFLASVEMNADRPRTPKMYRTAVNGLLGFEKLAKAKIGAIDEALVEEFKAWRTRQVSRRGKLYSRSTINRELATLRRMLALACEWRLIGRIPRVKQMNAPAGREFILSREQETAYLGATAGDYQDMAVLMLDAGFRVGEVLSLEWPQVHLKADGASNLGYVTIGADDAKGRKPRNVPMTPRLRAALTGRGAQRRGHVFHRDGEPLTRRWVQTQHDGLRALLGLPPEFVPHSLRHTFGTRLGESGVDAFTIMRLMGHSSITVSQKYVHPTAGTLERAIEGLTRLNERPERAQNRAQQENSYSQVTDNKQVI